MARSRSKALVYDAVARLHAMHFIDRVIAKAVGISPVHVRRILNDSGRPQRWFDVDDVRAALPDDLREACKLAAGRLETTR